MFTRSHTSPRGAAALVAAVAAVAVAAAARADADDRPPSGRPGVAAYFTQRSYAPGSAARLVVAGRPRTLELQILRVGGEGRDAQRDDVLSGVPVTRRRDVHGTSAVRIGDWRSGLYFARLTDRESGLLGYAVFVVRPRRLGEHRVAVVLPTNTWQAYNFRDEGDDGVGDTWYADPRIPSVDLERAFLDRGVPPHFRGYDRGFLRWLDATGRQPDFLSDDDLEHVSGIALARAYDLVVFSGHEEYVTTHEYDAIERYRDLGGNLAFLSANNFFYRVEHRGGRLYRTGRWRDVGRPEAALVGVQYLDWNHREFANAPYVVGEVARAAWLFRGTGLRNGSRFGTYGIEIDARTGDSPRGIRVLATIPDVFGRGRSAEMTYYTTPGGAKVFAAGSMNFGGSALFRPVSQLLENLWTELSRP